MTKSVIETQELTKSFNGVTAVDKVSFEVEEGEVFGFLGPNGAGKTTTINILCTLLKPTSGQAQVCGFDVVRQQAQVRQRIGLVFQDPSLDERITAMDNMVFHSYVYHIPHRERRQRIEKVLRLVELWERRNSTVKTFSGGMKRRLELARGLLHRPRLLFLDEPTLGLDPQTRSHIWEHIHRLRQEEGISIFLTTHYMEEAENAHRIAIIDRGRIVVLDTPERLKQQVGGDVLHVRTANDNQAGEEIRHLFGLDIRQDGSGLFLEVQRGDEFIPRLMGKLSMPVISVSLRRPTLDDVFLKLTGRELRDMELKGEDVLRAHIRSFMRPGR